MNQKTITPKQAKKKLKKHDEFGIFVNKPSADFRGLLDKKYDRLPNSNDELMHLFRLSVRPVVAFFKHHCPEEYGDLTIDTYYKIWEPEKRDCDNLVLWPICELQKLWSLNHKHEPFMRRIVVPYQSKTHAVAWGVKEDDSEIFFDYQTVTFWPEQKILAMK